MNFSAPVRSHLKFYVYGLVDPRDNSIFYIGKASANNRPFSHLKSSASESDKARRISDIRSAEHEPRVEILRYGLESEAEAFEVEAAIIDTIGLENLTNATRGHGIERGRSHSHQLELLYGARPVSVSELREPCMAFFVHRTFSPTMSEPEIYDSVRQFWHRVSEVNRTSGKYSVALGVVDGVVVRAYRIAGWFPAGSTLSSRDLNSDGKDKWEFVGQKIDDYYLLGRRLVNDDGTLIQATQKGFRYL